MCYRAIIWSILFMMAIFTPNSSIFSQDSTHSKKEIWLSRKNPQPDTTFKKCKDLEMLDSHINLLIKRYDSVWISEGVIKSSTITYWRVIKIKRTGEKMAFLFDRKVKSLHEGQVDLKDIESLTGQKF